MYAVDPTMAISFGRFSPVFASVHVVIVDGDPETIGHASTFP
jgi:hypothetical protein